MRTLGQLVLASRIAAGTLGDVFLARGRAGTEGAESPLAVKVLSPEVAADPRFTRLLLLEAPSAVRFHHPAAVRVHAVERADSDLYIAMEHVQGQSLAIMLKRAQMAGAGLDHALIAWIGAEIAQLLARIHATPWAPSGPAPMIHGALSPRSIVVSYGGVVKLLGVGLGRARLTRPPSSARLPYSAPEILEGAREPGPRADIYALGVLLHDALSTRPMFRRGTDEETRKAVLEARGSPLDPSALDIDLAVPELLAEMIQRLPEDRPYDLGAIERALRSAARGTAEDHRAGLSSRMREMFEGEIEFDRRATAARREPRTVRGADSAPTYPEEEPTSPGFSLLRGRGGQSLIEASTLDLSRRRIARYHTLTIVARAEAQVAFHASDPNLGRSVFLKVMDPSCIADPIRRDLCLKAFKREARIAGKLAHPSLPTIHDAGRQGDLYFMAYGWVEGESLAALAEREGRLEAPVVKAIAEELAAALAHAHERGVVICDLRPTSILLDDAGRPRFVDLALASESDGEEHPLLSTARQAHVPEYIEGLPHSAISDQFALGALLYQLLSGERPFQATDDRELARLIREGDPASLDTLDPPPDPGVAAVVRRLLEKEPAARFESCAQVAAALDPELFGVPGAGRARSPSKITLPGRPEVASIDTETLAWALVSAIERTVTIAAPMDPSIGSGPIDVARGMARRFRLGRREEVLGSIALAARGLAARMRLSPSAEEIVALLPNEVLPVLDEVDRSLADPTAEVGEDDGPSRLAQIVVIVERYFTATRPTDGRPGVAPRAAIRGLRDQIGRGIASEVVDALIERVREFDPGVEAGRVDRIGRKVLVMGERFGAPLVQALAHDGFEIERTSSSHEAWARIQRDQFAGTIVEQRPPGRDALSLLKLCREHPSTRALPFIILTSGSDPVFEAEVARAGAAEIMERSVATELIRSRVQRLMS